MERKITELIMPIFSDMVTELDVEGSNGELVRCKDCKHRPKQTEPGKTVGFSLEFPSCRCPGQCDDGYYSWYPDDDWFCANGERV